MATERTFERSGSVRERWLRLRNFQSQDFWAMVFARPMTILLLLPVADVAWITPNLITWASVAAKLAGLGCLVWLPDYWGGVAGALLVNLGLVLDNMDGTLARYRGHSSYLGYYLDKTVDMICLAGLFIAVALRAYWQTGDLLDLLLPLTGFAGASVAAYCKWVYTRVETDIALLEHRRAGTLEGFALSRAEQNPIIPVPQRTLTDWLRFLGAAFWSILYFNEVDIFFFLLLALVIDQTFLFTQVMAGCYALGLLIGPVHFYFKLKGRVGQAGLH
jgi:phosphatidylglycerophosphate synthase